MRMISAKIIADSKNNFGDRITTFILNFPRIVLAEFNTHRMFSRNSASSRAIPFKKMLELVNTNPFIPIKWMKEHSGMQGTEYYEDDDIFNLDGLKEDWMISEIKNNPNSKFILTKNWLKARDYAVEQALKLSQYGVTKQVCNRLLEPFMYHKVLLTATEFENFFALRADKNAEIHIQDLAEKMLIEYNNSEPKLLNQYEWHIPFGDKMEELRLNDLYHKLMVESKEDNNTINEYINQLKIKIAIARCARVSYNNFDGNDDYEADIKLFNMLKKNGHYSPFEHCARAMSKDEYDFYIGNSHETEEESIHEYGWSGNFRGFIQYRKLLENENRTDSRVIKK